MSSTISPSRKARAPLPTISLAVLSVAFSAGACRRPEDGSVRDLAPGTIVIRTDARLGQMRRPPVEFNHDRHQRRTKKGCDGCHLRDRRGDLSALFARFSDGESKGKLMDLYHDRCVGCHRRKGEGPRGCGECHRRRPPARRSWVAIRWDYSLHGRHSRAYKKRCSQCHHLLDPASKRLVYRKGKEEACTACHGARDNGRRPSLRRAAHAACISCHTRRRAQRLSAGPVGCSGCHSRAAQAAYSRTRRPERILRGQPDIMWVKAKGGKARRVPFDHRRHEGAAASCSSCHHKNMASCNECHTISGDPKGGLVTLEQAYHDPSSQRSCLGCHRRRAAGRGCVGCHDSRAPVADGRGCEQCHRGPVPPAQAPVPASPRLQPKPLPAHSKRFPEKVRIGGLRRLFGAARMPHGKIVSKLHALSARSRLALSSHGGEAVPCAGCHHKGRPGAAPTPCGSCHPRSGHPTADRPGLKVAYHRQCMGCHSRMGLERQNGCTSCHKPKRRAAGTPAGSTGGKK